jgi:hypothetical protein
MPNNDDTLSYVSPGDPLRESAGRHNRVNEMAREYLARVGGVRVGNLPRIRRANAIVQNSSGSNVPAFSILGIGGVVTTPQQNRAQFEQRPVLIGVTPGASYKGKWVITAEAIPSGATGQAFAFDVCPAWVNIGTSGDGWADCGSTAANLVSQAKPAAGGAQILWPKAGTGLVEGLVRFPTCGSAGFVPPTISLSQQYIGDTGIANGPYFSWSSMISAFNSAVESWDTGSGEIIATETVTELVSISLSLNVTTTISFSGFNRAIGYAVVTTGSLVGATSASIQISHVILPDNYCINTNGYPGSTVTVNSPDASSYTLNLAITTTFPSLISDLTPVASWTFDVLNAGTIPMTLDFPASALSSITGAGTFYAWLWVTGCSNIASDSLLETAPSLGDYNYKVMQAAIVHMYVS